MANVIVERQSLEDTADAIRAKLGSEDLIKPEDFGTEISKIVEGGNYEPLGGGKITGYNYATGEITGYGFGKSAGTVYLLDRATHTYTTKAVSSWSDTSIVLSTPIDTSVIEGTTSLSVVTSRGDWCTKFMIDGDLAVSGCGKIYVKNPSTGVVKVVPVTTTSEMQKMSVSSAGKEITIGQDTFRIDDVVGMQIGEAYTQTYHMDGIRSLFLAYATNLDQPLDIPSGIEQLGTGFMTDCHSFNQPIRFPSSLTSFSGDFMSNCYSFNQPLDLSNITDMGNFMTSCSTFNQPLSLPNVTSIDGTMLAHCSSFNSDIYLPEITSVGSLFLYYCESFNRPVSLPKVTSIADNFMDTCSAFNSPVSIPNVTSVGIQFMYACRTFNNEIGCENIETFGNTFMTDCSSFNRALDISSAKSIGNSFMQRCISLNKNIVIPSTVTSVGTHFMGGNSSLNSITVNTTVSPSDNNSLSTLSSGDASYVQGIVVTGSGASSWISNLPNRSTTPYRNLINGNT